MKTIRCPYCNSSQASVALQAGAIVDCDTCDRSFVLAEEPNATASRRRLPESGLHPTDVAVTHSAACAVGGVVLFYALAVEPLRETYLGELFAGRGWVPYAIAWLASWALSILVVKAWRLRGQRASLLTDPLSASGEAISESGAAALSAQIRSARVSEPSSLLLRRLDSAIEHYALQPRPAAVGQHLERASQADALALEGSYSLVRVFVWAIPILGFVGTVLGIGAAVAGFSESVAAAVDLEVMKQSIGSVTSGLGIAFDTTLLALVLSLILMLPTSALQKAEEDHLAAIDDYCETSLLRRLIDRGRADDSAEKAELGAQIGRLADAISQLEHRG